MKILTFDIEDWFHLLNNPLTENPNNWGQFENRIRSNMDIIFEILDLTNTNATFFCLGWIAEKFPDVIKEIDKQGYEIGSHSFYHQLVYKQGVKSFEEDLKRSINVLESLTGKKVRSYRAPSFSIDNNSLWAYEILIKHGITWDSSIFPADRKQGGINVISRNKPFIISTNEGQLKEFPINTHKFLGKDYVFSGGGYFRLAPYEFINYLSKSYVMSYFHPRDFDPDQPMIHSLNPIDRFKSYVGLKNCKSKLVKWLKAHQFIDLEEADSTVEWNNSEIIAVNEI